jgi:hypothetical protein
MMCRVVRQNRVLPKWLVPLPKFNSLPAPLVALHDCDGTGGMACRSN